MQYDDKLLTEVKLDSIRAPVPSLRPINETIVSELTRSIENLGLLQPVVVRRCRSGYEIVFGQHRVEACRRLKMQTVMVRIISIDDEEAFLARVAENLVRNSHIDPIGEAEGYRRLVERGWTVNSIAQKIGKCDSYVSERLALLNHLEPSILSKVSDRDGHITPSHAELLARIKDPLKQKELAEFVERKRLSVRGLEDMLHDAPVPRVARILERSDQYWLQIPADFVETARLRPGQSVFLYLRGNKLVLENINAKHRNVRRRHGWINAKNQSDQAPPSIPLTSTPASHVRNSRTSQTNYEDLTTLVTS